MADNKEFSSIDEVFRKTFSDLPETPSASGWDTPSEHVWQQVQTGISSRHTGWSLQNKILAMTGIAVAVGLGLYLAFSNPEATAGASPQPLIETPVVPAAVATPPVAAIADVTSDAVSTETAGSVNTTRKKQRATISLPEVPNQLVAQQEEQQEQTKMPRAGFPNHVAILKEKKKFLATPIQTLPLELKYIANIPSIPAYLKQIPLVTPGNKE